MAGCFKALCFWRRRSKANNAAVCREKRAASWYDIVRSVSESETAPLNQAHAAPASTRVPNPAYSADPIWASKARSTIGTSSLEDGATLNEEDDAAEAARVRRKAEQEEQERMDFLQMM